jgi:hypothetical protein
VFGKDFVGWVLDALYDPRQMEGENFLRLSKSLSKVVASAGDASLVERLMRPAMELLEESVHFGCQVVNAIASIADTRVDGAMICIWPSLLAALQQCETTDLFSVVCGCFANTVRTSSSPAVEEVFREFLDFAMRVADQDEAVVDCFTSCAICHRHLREFRQLVAERFLPQVVGTAVFFFFFEVFAILPDEEQCVVPVICDGIRDCDRGVSKAAVRLLTSCYSLSLMPFHCEWEGEFTVAVFDALFDQLHRWMATKLIQLLQIMLQKTMERLPVDQMLVAAVRTRVDDDEFVRRFVESVVAVVTGKEAFARMIHAFLVSAGRSNPSEIALLMDQIDRGITVKRQLAEPVDEEYGEPGREPFMETANW